MLSDALLCLCHIRIIIYSISQICNMEPLQTNGENVGIQVCNF